MSLADDYVRIQGALIDAVRGNSVGPVAPIASFWSQTRDAQDRITKGAAIFPAAVEANEVSAAFGQPERNRRSYRLDKLTWTWELRIDFHQNAILTDFEDALNESPILLRADRALGLRQVSFELSTASYQHQVAFGAHRGTRAIYVIQAKLWPL